MSLSKYNKVVRVFDKPENPQYEKLSRFVEGTVLNVLGLYTGTGNYGETCSMYVGENIIVNLPSHMVNVVKQILADENAVQSIKDGNEKCIVEAYFDRNKQKRLTIRFLDENEKN